MSNDIIMQVAKIAKVVHIQMFSGRIIEIL